MSRPDALDEPVPAPERPVRLRTMRLVSPRSPAVVISFLLHAGMVLLLLRQIPPLQQLVRFVPVELVQISDQTNVPATPKPVAVPKQTASLRPPTRKAPPQNIPLTVPAPTPEAPQKGEEPVPLPPKDALQSRLEAFAKLTIPGTGTIGGGGKGGNGGSASYDVRDFIRAQVERRWSIDVDAVKNRNAIVSIHVVLTADGTIRKVEIVNDRSSDADFHSLAISARNAVILSSPIIIPSGTPGSMLDMVLTLSPRDTLN